MLARFRPGNSTAIPVFPENSVGDGTARDKVPKGHVLVPGIVFLKKKFKNHLGVCVSILDIQS